MKGPLLVLGAAGQVGQELISLAAKRDETAVGLDAAQLDIRRFDALCVALAAYRPRLIVNCAAYTAVDGAETEPKLAEALNATAPGTIAHAAASFGIPLVHLSTDYVFDGTKATAYTEDDPISPLGVYGRTKAAGEAAVRNVAGRHVILRTSWLFGRYGVNYLKTVLRLAAKQPVLRVVADQRGCPTATVDLAEAILAVSSKMLKDPAVNGLFHFAGREVATRHEFASEIVAAQAAHTGRAIPVEPIRTADHPTPARRPVNSELDSALFTQVFGYRASDWRARTRDVVAEFLAAQE